MPLHGQLSISFLQIVIFCSSVHSQYLVVIHPHLFFLLFLYSPLSLGFTLSSTVVFFYFSLKNHITIATK
uniref:DnaJ homolog subfamily B member 13-like n=1 Tax=Rhizophora mucronata TaxID=61149 RepID=A0A2P2L5G1_RHIMU